MTINMHVLISTEFLRVLCSSLLGLVAVISGKAIATKVNKRKRPEASKRNSQGDASDAGGADSGDMETRGNG